MDGIAREGSVLVEDEDGVGDTRAVDDAAARPERGDREDLAAGEVLAGTRHLDAAPAVARDAHHFVGAAGDARGVLHYALGDLVGGVKLLGRAPGAEDRRVHEGVVPVSVEHLGPEADGLEDALGDLDAGDDAGLLGPGGDDVLALEAHAFGRDVMKGPVALKQLVNVGLWNSQHLAAPEEKSRRSFRHRRLLACQRSDRVRLIRTAASYPEEAELPCACAPRRFRRDGSARC